MTLIPINLATEDELSETVLERLLLASSRFIVGFRYRRGGNGYLKKTIHGWNGAAKSIPFLVLTDLDSALCPSALILNWLTVPKNPNLLFRVAVREVESWLLADAESLASYFGLSSAAFPSDTDSLADPKATLVRLARKSRYSYIRDGVAPRVGSTAKQGPDYNGCLGAFVRESWDVGKAMNNSSSLARTYHRLLAFAPSWSQVKD